MKRVILLAAAGVFAVWENVAMARWLGAHGGLSAGLAHAWTALRQDTLVLLVWTDMGVFSLLALAWFWCDLRRRGLSPSRRAAWFGAILLWGCPTLLVYLSGREEPDGHEAGDNHESAA